MSRAHPGLGLALLLLSGATLGNGVVPVNSGQAVTLGAGAGPLTVQTAGANPAAAVESDLGAFWFGLGSAAVGYEVGKFDDLVDQAEQLQDDLDRSDITPAEAPALEQRAEAFLQSLSDAAYVKLFATAQPPFLPMGGSFRALGGAFTLGATALSGARIRFLSNGSVDVFEAGTSDPCTTSCELETDFAGYGKGAAGAVISLGYSGSTLHRPDGSLSVGGRLNYYSLELSRGVVQLDDDGDSDSDAEDDLEDEFDRNRVESSALGVDLGVLWASRHFRAGATVRNLAEPEFDYAPLGTDCGSRTGAAARNCLAAASFVGSGAVAAQETYTMERQVQVESAVHTANRTWSLSAAYDVDAVRDAVGDRYQWLSVAAAYAPHGWGWLVPGLRVGYRQNQVGSELDYASLGLSLFRVVNLDVAASTQEARHDGDDAPRSAMASLSFELFF